MTTDFFYRDVSHFDEDREERDGSKKKRWLISPDNVRWLFKEGRNNTENWAEIVAAKICELLNIPHAEYELAQYEGKKGTITRNFLSDGFCKNLEFIPMREFVRRLCEARGIEYDEKSRLQKMYFTESVLGCLMSPVVTSPLNVVVGLHDRGAMFFFYGYLVLDALIANTDRHDENWGTCTDGESSGELTNSLRLTPAFDHGAAFCKEKIEKQRQRLQTKDEGFNVAAWCSRAKTPFHNYDGKVLSTMEVLRDFADLIDEMNMRSPDMQERRAIIEAQYREENVPFPDKDLQEVIPFWRGKISALSIERDIKPILNRFPPDIMLPEEKQFALEMLTINRERILETLNEDIK